MKDKQNFNKSCKAKQSKNSPKERSFEENDTIPKFKTNLQKNKTKKISFNKIDCYIPTAAYLIIIILLIFSYKIISSKNHSIFNIF